MPSISPTLSPIALVTSPDSIFDLASLPISFALSATSRLIAFSSGLLAGLASTLPCCSIKSLSSSTPISSKLMSFLDISGTDMNLIPESLAALRACEIFTIESLSLIFFVSDFILKITNTPSPTFFSL